MINTIIVENEKEPIKVLTDLLSIHFPEIKIQAICENLPDAVEQIRKLNPELLFLDVELQSKTTGFDVLQQTTGLNYRVIFTTSYGKYAERAIRYSALDFLKKPYGIKELTGAIEKFKLDLEFDKENARLKSLVKNLTQDKINNLEIMLSIHNGYQKLTVGNIIFCMSENGGTRFFLLGNDSFFTSKSLVTMEEKLKDCRFFRSHKSYLINLSHIKKILHVRDGAEVILSEENKAEVSRDYKAKLLELIANSSI